MAGWGQLVTRSERATAFKRGERTCCRDSGSLELHRVIDIEAIVSEPLNRRKQAQRSQGSPGRFAEAPSVVGGANDSEVLTLFRFPAVRVSQCITNPERSRAVQVSQVRAGTICTTHPDGCRQRPGSSRRG